MAVPKVEQRSSFYRVALKRYPVWTREEERAAGRRLTRLREQASQAREPPARPDAVAAADKALDRVVDEFVCHNIRLVFFLFARYRATGLSEDDLVQRGAMGLMRAARKFEPSRGIRFSTYAVWWIRQAITRGAQAEAHLVRRPTHMHDIDRKVRRVRARVAAATGREATDQEVAETIHKRESTVRRVTEAQSTANLVSLDAPRDEEGNGLYAVVRGHETMPSGEELLEMKERANLVRELLATLDPRDRAVLEARFGEEPETLAEIGGTHGVSRERVRQLEARALATLKRRAELRDLQEKRKTV